MSNAHTTASNAHKEAAKGHKECADHHLKAASHHDNHKDADAKTSSKSAMECCNTASKHSATACEGSAK